MTLSQAQIDEYRALKDSGVDVSKETSIKFHTSNETSIHACAKTLVGLLGNRHGYVVNSEVEVQNDPVPNGAIDVLLWGHPSRMSYACELEHSPTSEIVTQKLEEYVRHTQVDEIIVINLNDCPQDITEAFGWLANQIGLNP